MTTVDDGVTLPTGVVVVNRVIWAALVAGQVVFAVVLAIVLANGGGPGAMRTVPTPVVAVDVVLLAVGVVAAAACRRRGVTAGEAGVVRQQYARNVIVPMAVLEGASLFGLAVVLMSGQWWPIGLVPAASVLVQLTVWPRRTVRVR